VKKLLALSVLLGLLFSTGAAEAARLRLGVSSGPHTEIAEVVKGIAAEKGLEIEIVTFADFVMPNIALADGDLDVNSMQHLPYLRSQMESRGFRLAHIGYTVLMPMAVYSKRVGSMAELESGATVAIPNDPSNGGRALLLLGHYGVIDLDPAAGIVPSILDITRNELGLRFIELDAAQLPRVLEDADIAIINTNFAIEAGLDPESDALLVESRESPYVNIIVVREGEQDRPEFKTLVESYNNDVVRRFIEERFRGAIVVGW